MGQVPGADAGGRAQKRGDTPLHDAAYKGHLEVARSLLKAGASKDATSWPWVSAIF